MEGKHALPDHRECHGAEHPPSMSAKKQNQQFHHSGFHPSSSSLRTLRSFAAKLITAMFSQPRKNAKSAKIGLRNPSSRFPFPIFIFALSAFLCGQIDRRNVFLAAKER
jgi:hypothetical protein